ncbi:hypothetical protein [Fimbriiglobus ruber]|uniref:Uncharacterized protein n=1 Tax=Fimbriiglobus ruber TaxID=1908690 RepID=A0A225DTQ1_9BACT|nr:hypothetical protein [Fimbriiglobus ruber]OWK44423.1 hypothetical protein FRUB_02355 [Fimbriiglobus ruber]
MPATPTRPHFGIAARFCARRVVAGVGLLILVCAVIPARVSGQPSKTADSPRAGAVKLPDGTIVFFTKNPDEPNPPVNGVLLTPQEYKTLVDQSDQLKKLKEAPKPVSPSRCQVRGRVEARGDRSVAILAITYTVQTTSPWKTVALGGQRAFPTTARFADGKLPILATGPDGLTVGIEAPGVHTLTVEYEAPVRARVAAAGPKGDLGFDLGLPGASITLFSFDVPSGVKKVNIGVRESGEIKWATEEPAALAKKADQPTYPLGGTDLLELSWDAPSVAPGAVEAVLTADTDVVVRVSEVQIETVASFRLRGPARECLLALPPGADVSPPERVTPTPLVKPANPTTGPPVPAVPEVPLPSPTSAGPQLIRPSDPNKPVWTFRPPEGAVGEWRVTATVVHPRPKANDGRYKGPYAVGPFAVLTAARQTGTVKVVAPPAIRVRFKPVHGDLRRPDVPLGEDDLVGLFKFTTAGTPGGKQYPAPLLEFEAAPARVFLQVQPTYTFQWTEAGWKLRVDARVTPVRKDVDEIAIEVPSVWQVDDVTTSTTKKPEVRVDKDTGSLRNLTVLLDSPEKAPFDLTLTATAPVPPAGQLASFPVPRFAPAIEQGAKVSATVQDGLEVQGTATSATAPAGAAGQDLASIQTGPRGPGTAVTAVSAQFEKGVSRVDLMWHPHRPDLSATATVEIGLQEHQARVIHTFKFRATEGDARPVTFHGPAVGPRTTAGPVLEQTPTGGWVCRPPAGTGPEFTVVVEYALVPPTRKADAPAPPGPARLPLDLLWPDTATRIETKIRVWGAGTTRRLLRVEGPWRESPPEPDPTRDSLPWLTLEGTGKSLPLALVMSDPADLGIPTTTVDRALVRVEENGVFTIRGRFRIGRWSPAGIDIDVPADAVPTVLIDGKKVDPVAPPADAAGDLPPGARRLRVPVPEPRSDRTGLVLDVQYGVSPSRTGPGPVRFTPPRIAGATFRAPVRWQVALSADVVPLVFGRDVQADTRWAWRNWMFGPTAGTTTAELDTWFAGRTVAEPEFDMSVVVGSTGDVLTVRQPIPGPLDVVRLPRIGWVAGCSLVVFVAGWCVSRLRPGLLGPALGAVGVAVALLAVAWPDPVARAAAAAEPGLVVLAAFLSAFALVQWYYRWRVVHLPGFTREQTGGPQSATQAATASASRGSAQGTRSAPGGSAPGGSAAVVFDVPAGSSSGMQSGVASGG